MLYIAYSVTECNSMLRLRIITNQFYYFKIYYNVFYVGIISAKVSDTFLLHINTYYISIMVIAIINT